MTPWANTLDGNRKPSSAGCVDLVQQLYLHTPAPPRRKRHWFTSWWFVGIVTGALGIFAGVQVGDFARWVVEPHPAKPHAVPRPGPKPPSTESFSYGRYLYGNAKLTFPAGQPGTVSVVAVGPDHNFGPGGGAVPIAFRNNTSHPITDVDVRAVALRNGVTVEPPQGDEEGSTPAWVQPGEVGFTSFGFVDYPGPGLTYRIDLQAHQVNTFPTRLAPLRVVDATNEGTKIVGHVLNTTGKTLIAGYTEDVYCFSGNRLTLELPSDETDLTDNLVPNDSSSFTFRIYKQQCPTFVIGATGSFA